MEEQFKPTPEQEACIEAFLSGRNQRINAYAGTGKTSTLKLLARADSRLGTYVAFNKAIATEAAKDFPDNVTCSTGHSLAFRATMKSKSNPNGFDIAKMTGNVNGGYLAKLLSLKAKEYGEGKTRLTLKPRGYGWAIAETVKRWQRSGVEQIDERFVPVEGRIETLLPAAMRQYKADVARQARRTWEMMIDKNNPMPLGHDGYLKYWALQRPQLDGDYVLLDEAQDTNGVMMQIMKDQRAQVICVGDKHQSIYEWRGARNAMVELPADIECRLSTSWRFGPQIAGNATDVLTLLGEDLPLKGNPERQDYIGTIDKPEAILYRTNSRLIDGLFGAVSAGKKAVVVGGVAELLTYVKAAESLMAKQPVDFPLDFFGFQDWDEVRMVSEMEEGAQDLRRWVKLMDDYGVDALRGTLEGLPKDEKKADIILSTGHKSKGREWDTVRLEDDFLRGVQTEEERRKSAGEKKEFKPVDPEAYASELRLYYVAATRGKTKLEIPTKLATKIEGLLKEQEAKAA